MLGDEGRVIDPEHQCDRGKNGQVSAPVSLRRTLVKPR